MNKKELVNAVAKDAGLTQKDAAVAVDAVLDTIVNTLKKKKDERIQLVGFGTFEVRARKARMARNPKTGEEIKVKASRAPVFKAGKTFKDAVK